MKSERNRQCRTNNLSLAMRFREQDHLSDHSACWPRAAFRRLADRFGLTQLGVNMVTLEPGTQSGLRHWHSLEDELSTSSRASHAADKQREVGCEGDVHGFRRRTETPISC
jgi:uncharacterized cupin superfamily protein